MANRPLPDPLFNLLTRSREAGTPAAAAARDAVATFFTSLGYGVERHSFRFQPSALWAFPLLGAGLGWLGLLLVPLLGFSDTPRWAALAVWGLGAASLGALAFGVGSGATSLPFGGGPREDANLIATRSAVPVRCWIVAHLDTKAQAHSMAGRLVAMWTLIAAAAALTGLSLLRLGGALPLPAAFAGAVLALAAGVLAGRGRLSGESPGARDNGSGMIAALTIAKEVTDPGVGIIVTGAEEFGLAGSRALARERPGLFAGRAVLNFDTLDDTGTLYIVSHDVKGDVAATARAAAFAGFDASVRTRRLPTGILVDSVALARAGAVALTLARLDWSTLRRIHTSRDTADLAFTTAVRVARAAAPLI
ncbi:MAG TPA: M28 family peptidase [Gemmatimonadales bacterium]|nr:M28 family peptidase [Gemmatimonadales bacterium]